TVGKNNILVNQGVPVQKVAAATHSQIPQTIIRDQPSSSTLVANTSFSQRNSPAIVRHQPPPVVKPVKAVAQKVDAQHPLVQQQAVSSQPMPQSIGVVGRSFTPMPAPQPLK